MTRADEILATHGCAKLTAAKGFHFPPNILKYDFRVPFAAVYFVLRVALVKTRNWQYLPPSPQPGVGGGTVSRVCLAWVW